MSRYIDAYALKEVMRPTIQGGKELADGYTFNELWSVAENLINHIPTVDAVPVVRCKDCKYAEQEDYDYLCHYNGCDWKSGEHYCSYGEKVTEH